MSEIFAEETFQASGKEYTLGPLGFEDRGRFCRRAESVAIAQVKIHKADYGDDYALVLGQVKKVHWGDKQWTEFLSTTDGTQYMTYLMLKASHPGIDERQVAEFWPNPEKPMEGDADLSHEIVPKLERLLFRPNSPRPA